MSHTAPHETPAVLGVRAACWLNDDLLTLFYLAFLKRHIPRRPG